MKDDMKLDIDQIPEEELEKLMLKKACRKYFNDNFDSMDKKKKKDSFFKLLKRVIMLETILDSEKQVKKKEGAILENEKKE